MIVEGRHPVGSERTAVEVRSPTGENTYPLRFQETFMNTMEFQVVLLLLALFFAIRGNGEHSVEFGIQQTAIK